MNRIAALLIVLALLGTACSSDGSTESVATDAATETTVVDAEDAATAPEETTTDSETTDSETTDSETTDSEEAGVSSSYQVEVWADNWMAVYVDGELIGEDSVPITTERSFNSETFTFEASLPFTVAIEAKDFKETDSGIEYIGLDNQQMGDGGIIAQVTDLSTGEVVAATDATWSALVVHRAPLNTECEKDADPDATCEFEIIETPADWADADFDDSAWSNATEWSANEVGTKDGYDDIEWDVSAQLIWGGDLEVDNTILLRATVS